MFKNSGLVYAGIAAAVVAISPTAHAALTTQTSLFSAIVAPGTATPIALAGIVPPSATDFSGTGFSVHFSGIGSGQGIVQGTVPTLHAVPVAGATPPAPGGTPLYLTGDFGSSTTTDPTLSGNYFSTGNGAASITINFTANQVGFSLLWGSVDTSNSINFLENGVSVGSVLGSTVEATPGFVGNGFQGAGGSSYVTVNSTSPFNSVVLSSGVVSFESVALVGSSAVIIVPVPEPMSLALLGMGLLGVAIVRRKV